MPGARLAYDANLDATAKRGRVEQIIQVESNQVERCAMEHKPPTRRLHAHHFRSHSLHSAGLVETGSGAMNAGCAHCPAG